MPAAVLVIGLDAVESTLLGRWAGEGRLETLAHVRSSGFEISLANQMSLLPGGIWPELNTGLSSADSGLFYHPAQIRTGEGRARPIDEGDLNPQHFYWVVASHAERRVAVMDQVQTVVVPTFNGVQIFEWGLHDRHFAVNSNPPSLLEELRRRYGDHPVGSCDRLNRGTLKSQEELLEGLLRGIDLKTRLVLDVMDREAWDLVAATYGEAHCAGHQLWHLHDQGDPAHPIGLPPRLQTGLLEVYRKIDRGIAALVEAAGPGTSVVLIASHGMGSAIGGPDLLPEILNRLGDGAGKGARVRIASMVPASIRSSLRSVISSDLIDRHQLGLNSRFGTIAGTGTKAIPVRNNHVGAIRLNLKGREPNGVVDAGTEAAELIDHIRRSLLELFDPISGQMAVEHVTTSEEAFGVSHHPDLPDLLVGFRQNIGPIRAVSSHRIGTVRRPRRPTRSGDHTAASRLWLMGTDISRGTSVQDANVLDVAPTILGLLNVPSAGWMSGKDLLRI